MEACMGHHSLHLNQTILLVFDHPGEVNASSSSGKLTF